MSKEGRVDYLGWTHFLPSDLLNEKIVRGYIVDPNRTVQRLSSFMNWSILWPYLHASKREAIVGATSQVYLRMESLKLALQRSHESNEFSENKIYIQDQIELCERLIAALRELLDATPTFERNLS